MTTEKPPVVESKWSRILEYSVFVYPILLGFAAAAISIVFAGRAGTPGAPSGLALIASASVLAGILAGIVGIVLRFVMAVALYKDAKLVNASESEWSPSPALYAVGGVLFAGLATLNYLYERYNHLSMPATGNKWWYGVASSFAFAAIGLAVSLSLLPTVALVVASGLTMLVLPIAVYRDAAYVRSNGDGWAPNPVNYFFASLILAPFLIAPPLVGGYYLFQRNRHVGLA